MSQTGLAQTQTGPRIKGMSWLVIVALLATLVINALATLVPLGGLDTGEVSALYPVLFTPANYVFSIWSVIYLGLIAFTVYQVLPAQQDNERLRQIRGPFILNCVFNSLWIFAWQYLFTNFSIFLMLGILLTLIVIYERLGTGRTAVSPLESWLVRLPFSLYLAWITVATVANTSAALYNLNWSGWGLSDALWTAIAIGAATLITLLMILRRRDAVFGLVAIWAFFGIYVANAQLRLVALSAIFAVLLVALALLTSLLRRNRLVQGAPNSMSTGK